jgi:hypothetical protein
MKNPKQLALFKAFEVAISTAGGTTEHLLADWIKLR